MPPIHVQILPHITARELVTVAQAAERLGYASLCVSDEGYMTDPLTALGAIAVQTTRIGLGIITNPYTRHPAMTASAIATLDEISGGRAYLCYVAGGSLVLDPIGIPRQKPVSTVQEAITLTRQMLSNERITWQGQHFQLANVQIEFPTRATLPIHVAARGPKMLEMAAQTADVIWLGMDDHSISAIANIRQMSESVKIWCGDHPPIGAALPDAISDAVQQDGDLASKTARPQTFAAWGDWIRERVATYPIDELIITLWEDSPQQLIDILQQVADTLMEKTP